MGPPHSFGRPRAAVVIERDVLIAWRDMQFSEAAEPLREEFGFDFIAIGLSPEPGAPLSWLYVSGARDDRYRRILLSPGRGVGGIVLKSGRPMIFTDIDNQLDPREYSSYPIVFAEDLRSFCALPIIDGFETRGVLLCAFRSVSRLQKHVYRALFEQLAFGFCGCSVECGVLLDVIELGEGEAFYKPSTGPLFDEEDEPTVPAPPDIDPYKVLSYRELEVFTLLARGYTNKEIAQKVFLSVKTVEAHRAKIYAKLGIETRAQLVYSAIRHQLLEL